MKKVILTALLLFICAGVKAQEYQMAVQKTDGTEVIYDYNYEPAITFTEDGLVISSTNAEIGDLTIKFSEISKIYFKTYSGLKNVDKNSVFLYPNPATSSLHIAGADRENVQIYSMDGKMVYNGINDGKEINVSALEKGIYAVRINGKTLKFSKL